MTTLLNQGILGIVTGILTTVFIYLCKFLWDEHLRPFLQELRYQGVKIDGQWTGNSKDQDSSTDVKLFLTQNALILNGTFILKHASKDNNFEITFKASGQIWEGYVILNFTPVDRRITSYATSLLKIHSGGLSLFGQFCFRNVNDEKVEAVGMMLMREQS
jgi:hypothetical protein